MDNIITCRDVMSGVVWKVKRSRLREGLPGMRCTPRATTDDAEKKYNVRRTRAGEMSWYCGAYQAWVLFDGYGLLWPVTIPGAQ